MASVIGVCTLGGVVMLSGMRRAEAKTDSVEKGIELGALARVVVGGMITSPLAILFLLPLLASFFLQAKKRNDEKT